MSTFTRVSCVTAVVLFLALGASAQNLVITNARVLDGTGKVIDRGTVVVRDGKIASVSNNAPPAGAGRTIDAGGKTVMPGFIDAHRHLVQGNGAQWLTQQAARQFQEFLEAGFTTVVSAIDAPQVLEARNQIREGKMRGPRLFAGALIPLSGLALGGGAGDPARSRSVARPAAASSARDPARRHHQGSRSSGAGGLRLLEDPHDQHVEWAGGRDVEARRAGRQETRRVDYHARGKHPRHARGRRGGSRSARTHAAHRQSW